MNIRQAALHEIQKGRIGGSQNIDQRSRFGVSDACVFGYSLVFPLASFNRTKHTIPVQLK